MNMNNYYTARKNIFQGIRESSTVAKILMSFLMACFTGLMAQIIIPRRAAAGPRGHAIDRLRRGREHGLGAKHRLRRHHVPALLHHVRIRLAPIRHLSGHSHDHI